MDSIEYLDPESIHGLNLYAYCGNNPVMCVDPSGTFILSLFIGGIIAGAAIGFGYTAIKDYRDDGMMFNGSIGVGDYLFNTFIGGVIGGVVGGFIAAIPEIMAFASQTFTFGAVLTGAGGAAVTAGVTLTGTQVLAGAGVAVLGGLTILFSKGSDPRMGHNQYENKQFKEAMKRLNIKKTDPRWRIAHDTLDDTYETLKELIDAIKEILGIV